MNEFNAFARPVPGGYTAYLRTARDGSAKPILGKGGKPEKFGSELDAIKAAMAHLLRYINGHLVRDGDIITAEDAADAHFKPDVRRKRWRRRSAGIKGGANGIAPL